MWALALATGMRQGELLGLKWSDYEADRCRLHVERVLQRLGGEWLFPPPKTLRSRRVLSCSSLAVKALERQRRVQAEDRLRAGAAWEDRWGDLIFTGPTGKPRQSAAVTHHLVNHLQAVGLPRVRFHDLRHAAAS
ncbi:phage integrase family protein, partial [mine drainage metagenome]